MKEADVVRQIRELLHLLQTQGKLHWMRITTIGVPRGNGRFSKNPDQEGAPDFMLWLPKGIWIGIEAKSARGKLRPAQVAFQSQMTAFGHLYHVVRSVDEVIQILRRVGISP